MSKLKRKIYKNGATLIYKKNKKRHTSVVAGFVFGKNRDNYPEPTAHFCEHMFFKETKQKSTQTLNEAMQNTFSMYNGRTNLFYTEIDFCRSNKIIEPCFELASEMLLETKFSKKNIDSEKGVIKQELVRKLNNPDKLFYFTYARCLRDYYNKNTMVLGSEQEIDEIDAKTLKKFKDEVFISQNFVITIQGGISFYKAKRLAEKYFIKKLNSDPKFSVDRTMNLIINKKGNLLVEKYPFKKAICSIAIKIDKDLNNLKNEQISYMLCMICNGLSGKILNRLRDKGLVYSAGMSSNFKDDETIKIDFACSDQCVNKCIDEIGKVLYDLKTNLVDEKLIETKKKNQKYQRDEKTTLIYPSNLFNLYLRYGYESLTKKYHKKSKKLFQAVTPQDIKDFCNNIFSNPENLYVAILTGSDENNFYNYEKMQKILIKNNNKKTK